MERQPYGTDEVSKTRRILHRTVKKLERSYEVNGNSTRSHKKTIWQKAKEPSRVNDWGQCMVREQKYPLKQTLEKAGPKKIQTF